MSESEHTQNARVEAAARAAWEQWIDGGTDFTVEEWEAFLEGYTRAAADGIPQDTARRPVVLDVDAVKFCPTCGERWEGWCRNESCERHTSPWADSLLPESHGLSQLVREYDGLVHRTEMLRDAAAALLERAKLASGETN